MSYKDYSQADVDDVLEAAEMRLDELNDWEVGFIENISEQENELSYKQLNILWVIGEKLSV